jgi:hypothetical protein
MAVQRDAVFYEYYSNQLGGIVCEHYKTERGQIFMITRVLREAVYFYGHCSIEIGGFAL